MKTALRTLTLALAATVTLAACGSTTELRVEEATKITKGQELTDLKRALDEGAVTEREYETLRERILRRRQ